jgi:hypothetical protein
MPALTVIDTILGMVYVYLLLSLVVTAASEVVAAVLRTRSRMLETGVLRLLRDPALVQRFYDHPLIESLGQDRLFSRVATGRPSYIPAKTFALVLLDLVDPAAPSKPWDVERVRALAGKVGDPRLQRTLAILTEQASDATALREAIEEWFDNTMDRVSGWYKRRTQLLVVALSVLVTLATNADTLRILGTLWNDPAVRATLVAQAEAYAREDAAHTARTREESVDPSAPPPRPPYEQIDLATAAERLDAAVHKIEMLPLPIGWAKRGAVTEEDGTRTPWPGASVGKWISAVVTHAPGWILTVLALSLGAPFWFDVLKRIVSIRTAGKPPAPVSPERKSTTEPVPIAIEVRHQAVAPQ